MKQTTDERFEINYVDPSGLCEFARCPRKYMFDRCMGLKKPDVPSIAPDYGTSMHAAFPHCYSGDSSLAKAEFKRVWEAYKYGEGDKKRNTDRAFQSIDEFTSSHSRDICPYEVERIEFESITEKSVSDFEVPFLINIDGPLPLAGRIDTPVRWKSTGQLWALDYKTSSEISARYFDNFHFCPQACAYTIGLSHFVDEKVHGMIIEAVRVSPSNVENQLQLIFITEHQIEDFIEFAVSFSDVILRCNKSRFWPKMPTGCSPYGMFGQPGRYCEYKKLCDLPNWQDGVQFYERSEPYHPFEMPKED